MALVSSFKGQAFSCPDISRLPSKLWLTPSVPFHRPARSLISAISSSPTKPTVLVAERIDAAGLERLEEFANVDYCYDLTPDELFTKLPLCDAVIVSSETKLSREVFESSNGRLRVVGIAGYGIDNVNLKAANEYRCLVVNAPSASTVAVAEHGIALLMAMAKNVPQSTASVKSGSWQRRKYTGMQLAGKTLAVIGFGEVGFEVARRAKGLGMHVIAHDPYVSTYRASSIGIELVGFDKAITTADIISLHMHLTTDTRKLLKDEIFAKMKEGVQILNVAHAELIDQEALLRALDDGKVYQAALDVQIEDQPPAYEKLIQHERVTVTPNLGANTMEAQEELAVEIAEAVNKALNGELPATVVNEPMVPAEVLEELKPFIDLVNRLGKFTVQLIAGKGGLKTVKVSYGSARESDQLDTKLLRAGIIKGFIEPISSVAVNWVNGDSVAKQRGLRIIEERISLHGSPEYPLEFIQLQIANVESRFAGALSKAGELEVEGRVRDGVSYLTKIGSFEVDFRLEGRILLCRAIDQPGLIGRIGSILGEANVNISFMKAGRTGPQKQCMMTIKLDENPSEETLQKIRDIPSIHEIIFLKM